MLRPLVRSLASVALTSLVFFAARSAHAQDKAEQGADVMQEKENPSDEEDSSADDGGWTDESGASESGGLAFGLRLGFGLPLGDAVGAQGQASAQKLSDSTVGQIPIWVDLGWQATRSLMIGGYFSYGFGILGGQLKDSCNASNLRCSLGDIRAGAQAEFSFSPGRSVDPWLGAGLGYEWLHLRNKDGSSTLHGWEIPMIQGGVDFQSAGKAYVGPFVALSLATYRRESATSGGNSVSQDVPATAMHEWLFIGVRGVLH